MFLIFLNWLILGPKSYYFRKNKGPVDSSIFSLKSSQTLQNFV